MAEASCSGGTPFKRLIDHQSRGVSHQDRLVDRNALGQSSFRSSPLQPGQGRQDGFGAFIDSSPSPALPSFQNDPANRLAAYAATLRSASEFSRPVQATPMPGMNNWAADFGRFSAQTRPAQDIRTYATPSRQLSQSPAPLSFQAALPRPAFATPALSPATGLFVDPEVAQRSGANLDFDQEIARWVSAHGASNMEQVDAAMDEMARELEESEAAFIAAETATLAPETQTVGNTRLTDLETPEIGNLSLETREAPASPATEQAQAEADGNADKSAVAEAAEKLLECVKHEGGEKWQNSVFLSLMRDFRDGRKDIVGDEIRPIGEQEALAARPLT